MEKKTVKQVLLMVTLFMLGAGAVLVSCGTQEKNADMIVEFQDPLVERCVRIELDKGFDEPITAEECASLEQLTIDCDLEFSYVNNWYTVSGIGVGNYVDLCDLEYMTGLKELSIDNEVCRDMLVNLDEIAQCSKLEKLTMSYNPVNNNYYGTMPMGYKYLANIIEELPELTYLNIGYTVAEEHQRLLAGENNDLEFEDDFEESSYYNSVNKWLNVDVVTMQDVNQYAEHWSYGYEASEDSNVVYRFTVQSQEELDNLLERLPEDTEDLHIEYVGEIPAAIDVAGLEKFESLKTLSILNEVPLVYTDYYNSTKHSEKALEIENLDVLANNEELYSVSLCGVMGEFDDVATLTQIKELSLHACVFDSPEFLAELSDLRELVVVYNSCGDLQGYLLENGETFEELRYLRFENGEESDYEGIENYPKLESLSIGYSCGVQNVESIAECLGLKYLFFGTKEDSLDIGPLKDMESLKYLYIDALGNLEEVEGVEEFVRSDVVSVIMPFMNYQSIDYDDINDWIGAAVENSSLSCFIPYPMAFSDFANVNEGHALIDYKKLYEQNIMCKYAEMWMLSQPEKYPTMEAVLEDREK